MTKTIHERIQDLIEGTHEAFESCGTVNTDYAGFAAMALSEFKDALSKPDLTAHELRAILRQGNTSHRVENAEEPWPSFMARYVRSRTANSNLQAAVSYSLIEFYTEQ
jgi:hypothetical protein